MGWIIGLVLLLGVLPPTPTPSPATAGTLRVLLRDAAGVGIVGATLRFQQPDGTPVTSVTDDRGVAVSGPLAGTHVRLLTATLVDGTVLAADALPAGAGHRLALLPGQRRDVLLRRDGPWLVLDPDMLFSPAEPGEGAPATPAAFGPTPTAPDVTVVPPTPTGAPPKPGEHRQVSPTTAPIGAVPDAPASGARPVGILGLIGLLALLGLGWWGWRRRQR